ncbi:MAG: hypothetical protein V8S22_00825 [Lachnospiraceae bacterium]
MAIALETGTIEIAEGIYHRTEVERFMEGGEDANNFTGRSLDNRTYCLLYPLNTRKSPSMM